jgi:phage shock protein A
MISTEEYRKNVLEILGPPKDKREETLLNILFANRSHIEKLEKRLQKIASQTAEAVNFLTAEITELKKPVEEAPAAPEAVAAAPTAPEEVEEAPQMAPNVSRNANEPIRVVKNGKV